MKQFAVLLFAFSLHAQSLLPLPKTFFGAGAGYSASHASSSACFGILASQSAGLYSYSCYNSLYYQGQPTVSTETGAMVVLRCHGALCLFGSGTAGLTAGTGIAGAFSLGGAISWRFKSGFTLLAPLTWDKVGAEAQPNYRLLLGYSW